MIRDCSAQLVLNEKISGFNSGFKIMRQIYHCPEIAEQARPGNFILIKVLPGSSACSGISTSPLLRRPLGILNADQEAGNIEIAFRVVGTGTDLLASALAGQIFSVRGPVGGAFSPAKHENLWAVAGTMGVIPLLFLRSRLMAQEQKGFGKLLLGVPDKSWKDFADWVKARAPELELYSDDGSLGKKGFVTSGLDLNNNNISLVCCGPNPMMSALYKSYGASCDDIQVSLEKRMGCGMGGCFGCVVDTVTGRRRVCIDGPVFQAKDVNWDELHL